MPYEKDHMTKLVSFDHAAVIPADVTNPQYTCEMIRQVSTATEPTSSG